MLAEGEVPELAEAVTGALREESPAPSLAAASSLTPWSWAKALLMARDVPSTHRLSSCSNGPFLPRALRLLLKGDLKPGSSSDRPRDSRRKSQKHRPEIND